jgi:hypothetical protein
MIETCGIFHWKSETTIQTTSGSKNVWLRTLGGDQDQLRTDAALAASTIARSELEDDKSQLYTNHIAPLLTLDRGGLVETVLALQRGLFIREAQWRVEPYANPEPPEEVISSSGDKVLARPDLGDVLDWQETTDSLRGGLEESRIKWVAEQVEALQEELSKLKVKELRERATKLHKGAIIERAYNREWDWQTIFLGSFKDENCTKPFFSTISEVRGLPKYTFLSLAAAYFELDTFSRNPEKLKNLS